MIELTDSRAVRDSHATAWAPVVSLNACCGEIFERLDLLRRSGKRPLRTLGVTSCRVGEGVSTVAAHLATAAAGRQPRDVLVVDANLAQPSLAKVFGVAAGPGLAECVLDDAPIADVLQPAAMENLRVLAAGEVCGSPARVYDAANLLEVVADLPEYAAWTIFDLPPACQASCVNRLAAALDGVVLVVEAESVSWEAAARVKEILNRAGVRIVGAVLNKGREVDRGPWPEVKAAPASAAAPARQLEAVAK